MSFFDQEYVDNTFTRATYWNTHEDRMPEDFGEPQKSEARETDGKEVWEVTVDYTGPF